MSLTLGIDQSYTSTGYCLMDDGGQVVRFGTIKPAKSDLSIYDRALHIANDVCDIIDHSQPAFINLEGLAFGIRGDATRDLAGLLFTLINVIKLKFPNISCTVHAPKSVKKRATGIGTADKKQMIDALPDNVRQAFMDSGLKKTTGLADVTDAYWIASMALPLKQSV